MSPFYHFLNGMNAMGMLACGLFFFRAWRKAGDRLLMIFGIAFFLMAVERGLMEFRPTQVAIPEAMSNLYIIRLFAFVMILVAIADKNRKRASKKNLEER